MTPDPDALHSALAEALAFRFPGNDDFDQAADAILAYPAVVAALEGYSAALAGSDPAGLRERYAIGCNAVRRDWFVRDTVTDEYVSRHKTREAAMESADRLNAAVTPTASWLRLREVARAALAGSEPRIGYCSRDYPHSHTSATLIGADEQPHPAASEPAGLREAARRYLDATEACRSASDAAIREMGAARGFTEGYAPLDAALAEFSAAEAALRAALAATPTASPPAGGEWWECPSCDQPARAMGMCQTCGVFAVRRVSRAAIPEQD